MPRTNPIVAVLTALLALGTGFAALPGVALSAEVPFGDKVVTKVERDFLHLRPKFQEIVRVVADFVSHVELGQRLGDPGAVWFIGTRRIVHQWRVGYEDSRTTTRFDQSANRSQRLIDIRRHANATHRLQSAFAKG